MTTGRIAREDHGMTRTAGICPICEALVEYVDWPNDLPPQGTDGRYFDPTKVVQLVAEENEGRIREHLAMHTAGVILDA